MSLVKEGSRRWTMAVKDEGGRDSGSLATTVGRFLPSHTSYPPPPSSSPGVGRVGNLVHCPPRLRVPFHPSRDGSVYSVSEVLLSPYSDPRGPRGPYGPFGTQILKGEVGTRPFPRAKRH